LSPGLPGSGSGVVWYFNKTPLPFQDKSNRAEKPVDTKGAAKTPEPLPGKPGDKTAEKPRFEFYKILPGGQEATPGPAAAAPAAPPAAIAVTPAATEPASNEVFYLQAGAFQKAADADNLKAKLSLLGVDVGVQEVNVPEKGTMYRVRVGPYAKPDDMNRARNQLAQNGIQATVVKVQKN
jgi:cell division protein FtsN